MRPGNESEVVDSSRARWVRGLAGLAALALRHWFWILLAVCVLMVLVQSAFQYRDDQYLGEVAARVVEEAHADTPRERVIALRDFIRTTVRAEGAPLDDRPFLRATAVETLDSRLGYCGEVSRLFINMARMVGVQAQRVNLYGPMMHVVAEVELEPHERLIVDSQNPPTIVDLESMDQVIQRPEFNDYYTLNLRRLHLGWLVSRVRFEMGVLTYWAENPHALKGALWGGLIGLLLAMKGARSLLRIVLARRGWVHRSALVSDRLRSSSDAEDPATANPAGGRSV